MLSKYHFWKIKNSHIQALLGLDVKNAYNKLMEIREVYGKTSADDVRCFELCEHEKLDICKVAEILKWPK